MSVAKVYAKALYETARDTAKDASKDQMDVLQSQLDRVIQTVTSSRDTQVMLYGPLVTAKEKVAFLEEVAKREKLSPLLTNFLFLLARKGRLSSIEEVRNAFIAVRLAAEGGVQGQVVAADPVNERDVQGLADAFSKKLGKKVGFAVTTDPSLLAGMRVTVNGVTYDGTLRSQLQKLRDQLAQGATSH